MHSFEEFLVQTRTSIPLGWFVFDLCTAAILAMILGGIYVHYGTSISNRKLFSSNFMLITVTTMLIITIVKSSLALSLGLVGALSIIRFRAAVKEPEELAYLFLAIAIGLGFGANQELITMIALIMIGAMIILRRKFRYHGDSGPNLHLTVNSTHPADMQLEGIVDILKRHCSAVNLRRLDESRDLFEASFLVEMEDFESLGKTKKALQDFDESLTFTFLDNRGLY